MAFDFNAVFDDESEIEFFENMVNDQIKDQILKSGHSDEFCFKDLLRNEWEGIQFVEKLLEKSGIPSPDTSVCILTDIIPPYDRDFKNGETEEQFQKRYIKTAENLMINKVAESLIKLTANARYHINKGYISADEESRCPIMQMHKLFLEKSNESEFKFIDSTDYLYYSKYSHIAIVILRDQFDEEDKIQIPVDVKNTNVILFDTQLFTTIIFNNNKNKACTFELRRFKGIYKFNPETSSYLMTKSKIDVPLDVINHFL